MLKKAYALDFNPITGTGPYQPPINPGDNPAQVGGLLETFFSNLLGALTIIAGIAFLIYFLLGAFTYLTSEGDREKYTKAQRYISYAIIGMVIIVLAWAVTGIVGLILGFDILDVITMLGLITP